MKKFVLFFILCCTIFCATSCTEQSRARNFGGKVNIKIPTGYKVTSATWKDNDLFYFIEKMEDNYIPKEKKFIENSSYGVFETEVIFIETKN